MSLPVAVTSVSMHHDGEEVTMTVEVTRSLRVTGNQPPCEIPRDLRRALRAWLTVGKSGA